MDAHPGCMVSNRFALGLSGKPVRYNCGVVGLKLGIILWAAGNATTPFIYTEAPRYDTASLREGGERFPGGATLHVVKDGRNSSLIPGFAASADASVSYDGKRVLFSGKQTAGDRWQIWEVALDGGAPRRVVTVADDCITPFYLPSDRVVFSQRTPQGLQLRTAALTGGPSTPISFASGNPMVTDVLRDGRVLFEANHLNARELYTVYTDGSGVETHRCDHGHDRHAGRELASGDVVFENRGRLARFTSAKAVEIAIEQPKGEFAGPVAEVTAGEWLVSRRSGSTGPYSLYQFRGGQIGGMLATNAVQPVLVRPRTRPKIHPSSLGNREGANTLCLNVYTSKLKIEPGSVANVLVWAKDDGGAAIALGNAPVEKDGSFFVTAPADRPVRFELLDRAGKSVAAEKGWFWYRPGEQRVCVGCHAGPERAPENAQPQVLVRSTEPVKMTMPIGMRSAK